ncbi:hypothetical protein SAMN05444673_5969 [Bacillus sp. OV166]|nr:hypothetical protein SAMN05444673_5969 [Bacillus sp. OV166]
MPHSQGSLCGIEIKEMLSKFTINLLNIHLPTTQLNYYYNC